MTGSASFTMAFCLEAFTSRGSEALPSATWPDDTQVIGAVMRFALRKIPTYGWKRLQLSPRSVLIRGLCLPNTATWRSKWNKKLRAPAERFVPPGSMQDVGLDLCCGGRFSVDLAIRGTPNVLIEAGSWPSGRCARYGCHWRSSFGWPYRNSRPQSARMPQISMTQVGAESSASEGPAFVAKRFWDIRMIDESTVAYGLRTMFVKHTSNRRRTVKRLTTDATIMQVAHASQRH
jgi:hypothetical protein